LKLQEDDFAFVDDEDCSSSSIVSEADISRELELFRQQWYDEIHQQSERSSDAGGTRSKVHQLVVTSEPSDEDQVISQIIVVLIIILLLLFKQMFSLLHLSDHIIISRGLPT